MTNGLVVMTPSSISYSGTSASINADGSVVFSAITSLSLNGVFTGDYDNYMVNLNLKSTTTGPNARFRLRASGTDNSTVSSYTSQYLNVDGTAVNGARSPADYAWFFNPEPSIGGGCVIYFFGPYLSQQTASRSVTAATKAGGRMLDFANTHSVSSSYDGLTIYPSEDSLNGKLTVFGFNQ